MRALILILVVFFITGCNLEVKDNNVSDNNISATEEQTATEDIDVIQDSESQTEENKTEPKVDETTSKYLAKVVVTGDGIAEGQPFTTSPISTKYDASVHDGKVSISSILEDNGFEVVNTALEGTNTEAMRNRWEDDVIAHNPDIVYLQVGIRDIMINLDAYDISNNLRYFVQSCRENGIKLILANIGATRVLPYTNDSFLHNKIPVINSAIDTMGVEVANYRNFASGWQDRHEFFHHAFFTDGLVYHANWHFPSENGYELYMAYILENSNILRSYK